MTNFKFAGFPVGSDVQVQFDQGGNSKAVRAQHYKESHAVYIARKKAEPDPMPDHSGDMTKHTEHMVMMDLVPKPGITNIALKDGSFEDPGVWSNDVVPGNNPSDTFFIPNDVKVTVTAVNNSPFDWGRIDGTLEFSRANNTRLVCNTLLSSHGSLWDQGTEASPIPAGVRSEIFIRGDADLDPVADPQLSGRGVLLHGQVYIHGADRTTHARCATVPTAGATSLTLESAPDGWEVGDMLVIPGTTTTGKGWNQPTTTFVPYDDEVRTITGISGAVISWSGPLSHARSTPRADIKLPVMNMTRNVLMKSQNEGATPNPRRGHFMVMHTGDLNIQYLECAWMGRTDKSVQSNLASLQLQHSGQNPLPATANVQGRYALHIHRNGVKSRVNAMGKIWGCSVRHNPGWGIVHHESHLSIKECTVYDVFGAGIVGERGTETGEWIDNMCCKMIGVASGPTKNHVTLGDHDATPPFSNDMGRHGDGYWFQGRTLVAEGNIACNCNHGFNYFHRLGTNTPEFQGKVDMLNTYEADPGLSVGGATWFTIHSSSNVPSILHFQNNEAFGCKAGVEVEKASPAIGHEIYSILQKQLVWNARTGMGLAYTGHYLVRGNDFVNCRDGIVVGSNLYAMVFAQNTFTDCTYGIYAYRVSAADFTAKELGYVAVNNTFINVTNSYFNNSTGWDPQYPGTPQGSVDVINDSYTLPGNTVNIGISGPLVFDGSKFPIRNGTRTDELSDIDLGDPNFNNFPHWPDPTGLPNSNDPQVPRGAPFDPIDMKAEGPYALLKVLGYWQDGSTYYTVVPIYMSDRLSGKIYLKLVIGTGTFGQMSVGGSTFRGTINQSAFLASRPQIVSDLFGTDLMNTTVLIWSP